MKKIFLLFGTIFFIISCKQEIEKSAIVYERKHLNNDSVLIKYLYELENEKFQDSFKILATQIIPDSFLIKIQRMSNGGYQVQVK